MPDPPVFSRRQRQIVALLARGASVDEMAEALEITPRTVRAHCDVLRKKLNVKRRAIPFAYRRLTGRDPLDAPATYSLPQGGNTPEGV